MNVTIPKSLENIINIDNMYSIDNTYIEAACGSGKKYKQCCGK